MEKHSKSTMEIHKIHNRPFRSQMTSVRHIVADRFTGYVECPSKPPQETPSADYEIPRTSLAERLVVDAVMYYLKVGNFLESLADKKIAALHYVTTVLQDLVSMRKSILLG